MLRRPYSSRPAWRALACSAAMLALGLGAPAGWADDAGSGSSDETRTEGQVVGISSLAPRPFVQIVTLDGSVALYFADAAAIAASTVHFGDYITVSGQKIDEHQYTVDEVSIEQRALVNPSSSLAGPGSASSVPSADDTSASGGSADGTGSNAGAVQAPASAPTPAT